MTGPDLYALAADLESALWARLRRGGFAGQLEVYPSQLSGGIVVEIAAAADLRAGSALVPVEALTDRAAFPGVVEHLAAPFVQPQPRRVNAYVGLVVVHHTPPGHPDHAVTFVAHGGAWGNPADALDYAADRARCVSCGRQNWAVRVVDVDTREEWYTRP